LYFSVSGSALRRAASAMGLLAIGVAFVRSGSRGGFLAILAVGLYVLFGYTTVRAKWRVLGTVVVAGTLLVTAGDKYWTQMRTIFQPDQDYNRSAETGRIPIWKRGIGYMVHHPFLGVGLYNFPVAEGTISPQAERQEFNVGVAWTAAHNSYVQVGAELGVPGLGFLLTIVLGSIAAMRRMAKIGPAAVHTGIDPARLAQALAGALIGFAVGGFFLSLAYHEMLYALAGLAAALSKVMPARATVASPRPSLAQPAPMAGLTGVTIGSAQRSI